ncbi:hypothetical protein M514_21196 [Trichuris suis]|uniref:Uncharacterized protein n=1 Tax=Trichuris suis TaxID=68888 RepID=A0A085NB33_9BILA|nr:hypothetical protein M514_21196 [Trichuris suis]
MSLTSFGKVVTNIFATSLCKLVPFKRHMCNRLSPRAPRCDMSQHSSLYLEVPPCLPPPPSNLFRATVRKTVNPEWLEWSASGSPTFPAAVQGTDLNHTGVFVRSSPTSCDQHDVDNQTYPSVAFLWSLGAAVLFQETRAAYRFALRANHHNCAHICGIALRIRLPCVQNVINSFTSFR